MGAPEFSMTKRKIGDTTILEFDTREEALAYAESKQGYQELLAIIANAELAGLISAN